jgi:hypothetical protein
MFSSPLLAVFINALPIAVRGFFSFFLGMLVFPLYVTEANSSSLPVVESVASSPAALPSVAGPLVDLTANQMPFSVSVPLVKSDGKVLTSGSFNLYNQPGLTKLTYGRASASISDTLNVSIIAAPNKTLTVPAIYLAGACAIIPAGCSVSDISVARVAQLPGSAVLNVSMNGSITSVLGVPPGIQTDANLNQVIGAKPLVTWCFNEFNISEVVLVISGTVTLSGLGYPKGFF